ncbi:peptide-methionine (S)-S-oxide reductase MsrA [Candidatus Saccharibacteria bacterium]|nr:peptide-methionine (S)-S-oxide reductase MsrA [Candidatus Saccharibacteria bacterium]
MKTYVLAGGCFWCIDAVFRRLQGVESTVCGYTGGTPETAHYYSVATGQTGHAEAVKVTFDETILPAGTLLDLFFLIHDPTTLNRQGADVGPQYRSAMFYGDDIEKSEFEAAAVRAQEHWENMIVTDLTPLGEFYDGESEHQDYFNNNPTNGYCSIVIEPKIVKARKAYARYFKD